jgi:hypothetical protein
MRAKCATHGSFLAQTPFSGQAQKKVEDPLITRFEFPTDSHDFNYFSHYIYYFFLSTFFSHFFEFFSKKFCCKLLHFLGTESEQKNPLFRPENNEHKTERNFP